MRSAVFASLAWRTSTSAASSSMFVTTIAGNGIESGGLELLELLVVIPFCWFQAARQAAGCFLESYMGGVKLPVAWRINGLLYTVFAL